MYYLILVHLAHVRSRMLNISARDNYELLLKASLLNMCGNTKQTMYDKSILGKGKLLCVLIVS